jgi:serine/threonine protein kinase
LKEIEMGDDDNPVSASGRSYDHEMQIMSVIPPHPHVLKLIDSFSLGSKFYIVVEYCDKGDLSDYLRRTSAPPLVLEIPELKIWKFIIQTLLALDHIHD